MRSVLDPLRAAILVTLGGTAGCFAVADLGRFHQGASANSSDDGGDANVVAEGGVDDPTKPSNLALTLVNMGVHFQQLIEARVIDNQNGIQSRIVIQPLDRAGAQRIAIHVPSAIPREGGPYRLDFYADVNYSGGYDGIGKVLTNDHAWRIEPLVDYPANQFAHVPNLVQATFLHTTLFADIDHWPSGGPLAPPRDTGLSARIHFAAASLAPYMGKLLQLRIQETRGTEHTVAVYRIPQIPDHDFEAILPGVLDDGFDYFLKIYIDANGNSQYDNPAVPASSADLGFVVPVRSMANATIADAGSDAKRDAATDSGASSDSAAASDGGTDVVFGIDEVFDLTKTPYRSDVDVGEP